MKALFRDIRLIRKGLKEIHDIQHNLLLLFLVRSIFQAVTPFVNIYMSARILNKIAEGSGITELLVLAMITVVLNLFIMLGLYLLNHMINFAQAKFNARYEMRLSLKLAALDYADVENPKTHMLRQKIAEMKNMNGGGIGRLAESIQVLTKNSFTIIFAVSMTFSLFFPAQININSDMSAIVASPIASLFLIAMIFINVWINMYANVTVTAKMYEIMNGILPFNRVFGYYMENYISTYHAGKDIRIYHQEKLLNSEFNKLFSDFRVVSATLSRNQFKFNALTSISTVIVSTLIYLFVGLKALAGLFGIGMIVRYVSSINEFTNGFTGVMGELSKLRANNEAMRAYFEFMSISSNMYKGTLSLDKTDRQDKYEIEFKNVSFRYPESDNYVLRNLNLKLRNGKRIAIVGENGSGKTTMIKLLCRLYDPTEGEILLNGVNIKQYSYDEYLSLFSVVFQDYKLFSFSIAENVAVNSEYQNDKVDNCLKEAGFGDRLSKMPAGIETHLYKDFVENGVEVSGGEAQKIALARALYKDAPLIVLDEPTAALDPIAEEEIYSRFNDMVKNKTAIYISHRLSSCRFCDNILVFDKGELVQQGSHETLSKEIEGKYYKLWNSQAQYYVS